MYIITLLTVISVSFADLPCRPAEDKPTGQRKGCQIIKGDMCCTWHYVEDRMCFGQDHDCTKIEAADDSMNALRVLHTWCYKKSCGWLLHKEGYYNNWGSNDHWSKVNRRARKLVLSGKYKKAKRFAKRALRKLVKLGLCKKGEPCDDNLEFIAYASIKELKKAAEYWRDAEDGC